RRDRDRDGEDEMRRAGRGCNQHDEGRLGRIGHRRERVRGEDRERKRLREQRLLDLATGHRAADDRALEGADRRMLQPRVTHATAWLALGGAPVAIITGQGASFSTDQTSRENGRRKPRCESTGAPTTISDARASVAASATPRPSSPGLAGTIWACTPTP